MRLTLKIIVAVCLIMLLLLAIAAKMPAQYALAMASSKTGMFSFNAAQGSLWQGQVHGLVVNTGRQSLPVGKLTWQLSPWSLLALNADLQFKSQHPLWKSEGQLKASIGQKLLARNVQVSLPLALITQLYPVPAKINGTADITIEQLGVDGQQLKITALNGQVLLQAIDITIQSQATLGSYGIRLKLEGDNVIANITDVDAPLRVSGQLQFDQLARSYQTAMTVTPESQAGQVIQQSLQFIGKKQSDGSYLLNYQGQL